MRDFLFVIRGRSASFAGVMAVGLALHGGMTALNPLFLKYAFDECVTKADFRSFALILGGVVLLATAARFLSLACGLSAQALKSGAARDLAGRMLTAYYRQPHDTVLAEGPGYFSSRILDEPIAAANAAVDLTLDLSGSAVCFVVSACVVAALSPAATATLAATVPLFYLLAARYGDAIKRHAGDEKDSEGRMRAFVTRAAQAHRTVTAFGLESGVAGRLRTGFDALASSVYGRVRASGVQNTLASVLMSYAELLVMLVCGYEMIRGRMTFGGFMAFMTAFWAAVGHLRTLIGKAPEVVRARAAVERLRRFEAAAPPPSPCPAGGRMASLEEVAFRYGDTEVLSGLGISIADGERLLVQGCNGSGKSTLASVMAGFLRPTAGRTSLPGLQRTSACVSPFHFAPGTLAQNLGSGSERYRAELLDDFGLTDLLEKSPDELSAGQRKKAEVAMGLLKEADLYLFDEPLANVDAESKPRIMRRILERTEDRMLVVIMHGDDEYRRFFDRRLDLHAKGRAKWSSASMPAYSR